MTDTNTKTDTNTVTVTVTDIREKKNIDINVEADVEADVDANADADVNDETIDITFKNELSELTHTFRKKDIENEGFFRGLFNNSMKEGISGCVTVHFPNAGGMLHPIYFPLDPFVFQTMELLFRQGENVIWDEEKDSFTWLAKGKLVYQLDKLFDYFLCTKFKTLLLKGCHQRLSVIDSQMKNVPMEDIVYIVLFLMDNQYDKLDGIISAFYRNITSFEKEKIDKHTEPPICRNRKTLMERVDAGLDIYFLFYQEIMTIVEQTDFYRSDPQFYARLLFLLNRVRGSISDQLLQNKDLSDHLLLTPQMMEGYFHYSGSQSDGAFNVSVIAQLSGDRYNTSREIGEKMILSPDEAILQFKLMTQGMLENMPWDNVALCGGSANIILDATLKPCDFPASDIDLFIYGADSEERRLGLQNVLRHFFGIKRRKFIAVNRSVVGIFIEDCPTVFQIIISDATSILDIIHHFDLDHLRMAFDGSQFYMTVEAAESLRTKSTHINKWGITLKRIWKTLARGYNIIGDINLAEDCLRVGRNARAKSFVAAAAAEGGGDYHKALLEAIGKYQFLTHKYYFPRSGEFAEKVKYEIGLHYSYSTPDIFEGRGGEDSGKDLEAIFKDHDLKEADFRKLIGNSYLSAMLNLDMEKVIFRPSVGYRSRSYGLGSSPYRGLTGRLEKGLWACKYLHIDPFSNIEQNITISTPLCLLAENDLYGRRLGSTQNPKHWRVRIANQDFVSSVRKIVQSLWEKLQNDSTFIEWRNHFITLHPVNAQRQGEITLADKFFKPVSIDMYSMLVKVNFQNANLYLSNGKKADRVATSNILQRNLIPPGTKLKMDLNIARFFIELDRMQAHVTYNVVNIYLMNDQELRNAFPMIDGRNNRMQLGAEDDSLEEVD